MIGPATALSLGAAIACAALPPPVQRLAGEPGGNVQAHMERMLRWHDTGTTIVVDGPCGSSCALAVVALSEIAPERVVFAARAQPSFQTTSCHTSGMLMDIRTAHSTGQSGAVRWLTTSSRPSEVAAASTERWLATFPPALRAEVARHGDITRDETAIIAGARAARLLGARTCQ